jgi:hypothetical protein
VRLLFAILLAAATCGAQSLLSRAEQARMRGALDREAALLRSAASAGKPKDRAEAGVPFVADL